MGRVIVYPEEKNGNPRWIVEFKDVEGKRRRKTFSREREAKSFAAGLGNELAEERVVPMSLPERLAWGRLRGAMEAGGWGLAEAVGVMEAALAGKVRGGVSVEAAVREFLGEKERQGLRGKTVQQLDQVLGLVREAFAGRRLAEVKGKELGLWVEGRYAKASSRQTVGIRVRSWGKWCVEKGWWEARELAGVKWGMPRLDEKRVEFLTAAQTRKLLEVVDARLRASVALQLFSGVRPEEARRLDWADVNFETRTVTIGGEVAKTRAFRRLHDLPANLWAWLETVPVKERTGPMVPMNERNQRKFMKRAKEAAGIVRWPQDALRHSFGTHAWYRGAEWTVATMGHVSGFDVLARHYRGCVSEGESKEYFGIMPK